MELKGLERLLATCKNPPLSVETQPPRRQPPSEGTLLCGHPLDPVLAAVYSRLSRAVFAADVAGMGLHEVDTLEQQDVLFQEYTQPQLALPLFVFGGDTGLAHLYAVAPGLADERGRQSVVRVNAYDEPHALPIASDVDRFCDTYARFLEALVAHPRFAVGEEAALVFPWDVPELLARDERLVEQLRAGCFDALMPQDSSLRHWVAEILGS